MCEVFGWLVVFMQWDLPGKLVSSGTMNQAVNNLDWLLVAWGCQGIWSLSHAWANLHCHQGAEYLLPELFQWAGSFLKKFNFLN